MNKVKTFERDFAGRKLKVELGRLANQANGSCTVSYGDTVVLATVVIAAQEREGIDYFPLMVDYEEKLYAAGKIKGSRFIKREGRASDEAVLTARLIDRSIRPLFKDAVRRDVQVIVTILSIDGENDPDVPAMLATSIALGISNIPWGGPLGGARVGRIDNKLVINPVNGEREKSDLDLFIAGGKDDVVMIEAGAEQVNEKDFYEAIAFGHKHAADILTFVEKIIAEFGVVKKPEADETEEETASRKLVEEKVKKYLAGQDLTKVFSSDKAAMKDNILKLKEGLDATLKKDNEVTKEARLKGIGLLDSALEEAARDLLLKTNKRVDGRAPDEIRELSAEVAVLPRTHGTGLFQRGETQVLSIITLGSPGDEQTLDTMELSGTKRYMHHYNFPPFSVGEVKPMRGPSRRDIGHGALAEKAILPLLPGKEDFPYTIRVVSEVLSSNGSSSQASICGSSLALMDAGVPIKSACAGIAIGLVTNPKDKSDYRILTDIQGIEDHAFDMDFKVGGTDQGITAIQMDIKLNGINLEVIDKALQHAKVARQKILSVMNKTIVKPREELSEYAPRIVSITIPVAKIREVIGSGGKVINEIIEKCGIDSMDIDDDGIVSITSHDSEGAAKAREWVASIVKEIEIGEIYEGTVTQIITDRNSGEEIGAIVELLKGKDGMVHISQFKYERINKVSEIVKVGDKIKVKVTDVDSERGRVSLSAKALLDPPAGGAIDYRSQRPPRTDSRSRGRSNQFRPRPRR